MNDLKKMKFLMILFFMIFGSGILTWHLRIAEAQTKPLTYSEVITALKTKLPNSAFKNKTELIEFIIAQIKQRRVEKPLTSDREDLLRESGATDELIEIIRQNSPALPTPKPTQSITPIIMPTATPQLTPTPSPTPVPTPVINADDLQNYLGMVFVKIPAGTFMMGSNNGEPDEKPVHQVTISKSFYLGRTEVTQSQWVAIMGSNPSYSKGDNLPVEKVSWADVREFIEKLNAKGEGNYRLPTEAEWEYACRAGTTGDYPEDLDSIAWLTGMTHEVATKKPNAWGLYDMNGNVSEWTSDIYDYSYPSGNAIDPVGAKKGWYLVHRGGSWQRSTDAELRSANREYDTTVYANWTLGFRLVKTK